MYDYSGELEPKPHKSYWDYKETKNLCQGIYIENNKKYCFVNGVKIGTYRMTI